MGDHPDAQGENQKTGQCYRDCPSQNPFFLGVIGLGFEEFIPVGGKCTEKPGEDGLNFHLNLMHPFRNPLKGYEFKGR